MARLLYTVNIPRFFVTHRLPLALAAREAGYEIHVATSDADRANIAHIEAAGLPFHPLPLDQHGTRPDAELRTLAAIVALYRRLRPDLIHHVSIKAVAYGGLAARLTRIPAVHAISGTGYVFSATGARATLLRAGVRALLRPALAGSRTRALFQNPDDRDTFVRLGLVPADKTVIIKGSGVDMTRFTPTPQPEGPPLILFAGRLIWQKGIGDFVAAARALKARGLEARFVIVGYPEASSPAAVPAGTLDAWAAEGVIEWWGRRDDMPAVYAGAHIVCLPSSYGEGVPKVLIEAAACGRPAVATDAPGCREIVHDGANGLLVPVGDHEALCAALETLATDPARRAQMGMRGRQIAEAEFALTQVLDRTLALYRELLGE